MNKFIALNNERLIFRSGKYRIGRDIPAGEYYFWGADIWYSSTVDGEKTSREFKYDTYATLAAGTVLEVSRGKFTPISNVIYFYEQNKLLYPNHIYRVGAEIPTGFYLFKFDRKYFSEPISSFCAEDDAALNVSEAFPSIWYTRFSGNVGIAEIKADAGYVSVNNGIAEYLGEQSLDLYSLIISAKLGNNQFCLKGDKVFSSRLCDIIVYKKNAIKSYFHGGSDACISEQYFYSVNGLHFWAGIVNMLTFRPWAWFEIIFEDSVTGNQYHLGGKQIQFRRSASLSYSAMDDAFRKYRVSDKYLYEAKLPDGVDLENINIVGLRSDFSVMELVPVVSEIRATYSKEFAEMTAVISQFQCLGLHLDIEKELGHFEICPDFLCICLDFLKKRLGNKKIIEEKTKDENLRISFRVDATYDKAFYCAAKLADKAIDIQVNDEDSFYTVTFSGTQVDNISLMYGALITSFNSDRDDLVAAQDYLIQHDFLRYLSSEINRFIFKLNEEFGYSPSVTGSVLVSINKSILKRTASRLDELYTEMAKESRITTRWGNEYKLFMLISKIVEDAKYQYRTDWLGQQSFDIFIPTQNVAIEYQGQQHYEAVNLFGGKDALFNNQRRDARKKELSSAHGVRVLDWKYTIPVNMKNVLSFLSEHGVEYSLSTQIDSNIKSSKIQMAPIIAKEDTPAIKEQKPSEFVIRQFDLIGKFIAEYDSLEDACSLSGVSEKSIKNVIYGARKSGGGYIWSRQKRNSPILDVSPIIKSDNTGLAKEVFQYDKSGNLIAEYPSIGQASKITGINSRSISDAVSGIQKTAGGFIWAKSQFNG